ncbi:MAG: hypothetical protein MZV64_31190 [Ignavibacteriales bacterium]|nr:hypothetical protein [Ignavibacteriales bacterium]
MKESEEIETFFSKDDIISVEIPIFVYLKVVFRLNQAFAAILATESINLLNLNKCEHKCSSFINEGDVLKVDTRTGRLWKE